MWTINQAPLALKCTILTPEVINVTLGRPLTLTCWSDCSTPVDPLVWKKGRHTICQQRAMRSFCFINLTEESKKQNENFSIQLAVSTLLDAGEYSCVKTQRENPDIEYHSSLTHVFINPDLSKSLSTNNFWLHLVQT